MNTIEAAKSEAPGVRRCSLCRRPGHRRTTCPEGGGAGEVLPEPLTGRARAIADRQAALRARERAKTWAVPPQRDEAMEALARAAREIQEADAAAGVVVLPAQPPAPDDEVPDIRRKFGGTIQPANLRKLVAKHHLSMADVEFFAELDRPLNWGECCPEGVEPDGTPRPRGALRVWEEGEDCPWVGCKYHLGVEVGDNGGLRELSGWRDGHGCCALELADRGGLTLEHVGGLVGVTRERVRQIELKARILSAPVARAIAEEERPRGVVHLAERVDASRRSSLEIDAAALRTGSED